jgi:hypothetical protein
VPRIVRLAGQRLVDEVDLDQHFGPAALRDEGADQRGACVVQRPRRVVDAERRVGIDGDPLQLLGLAIARAGGHHGAEGGDHVHGLDGIAPVRLQLAQQGLADGDLRFGDASLVEVDQGELALCVGRGGRPAEREVAADRLHVRGRLLAFGNGVLEKGGRLVELAAVERHHAAGPIEAPAIAGAIGRRRRHQRLLADRRLQLHQKRVGLVQPAALGEVGDQRLVGEEGPEIGVQQRARPTTTAHE